jgi:predicted RNA binding protein YcfA (HicA-like mRNA interferase family)
VTTLKTAKIKRALLNKFGFEPKAGSHRIFRLYLDGKLVARTYISHGQREVRRYHIGKMSRQMRLNRQEFLDAIECPLTRERYYELLRQRLKDQSAD